MKEATLSAPSSSPSQSSQSSDVEEYQVDTISRSSSKDDEDQEDYETDGPVVIAEEPSVPSFGSVSVVNSNDIHFGNKTVYQGPVTIKQFVYPNSSECISGLEETRKVNINVDLSSPKSDGVNNPAFESDNCATKDGDEKVTVPTDNPQDRLPGVRKGFLCLQHIRKEHTRDIVLFFSVVIASVTIVTAVLYWKNPSYVIDDFSNGDTDEQENNTPVDYLPDSNTTNGTELRILPRLLWLAQPPTEQPPSLKTPVPLVVIHHTATQNCTMQGECIYIVRNIQQYHIESKQWWDIGYNFLIGGDGAVYEGRGWKEEGAHTFGYNYISLGVAFIGTFSSQVPPEDQIVVFNRLIAKGVELGYIKKNYKILGARQLFDTDSPGSVFYEEIQTWPRWSKEP